MPYPKRILSSFLALLLLLSAQSPDLLYKNYVAAVNQHSTFQYYLVITAKNGISGKTREICTKGNFLLGAIHREANIGYSNHAIRKAESIALRNKSRHFEFKNTRALTNLALTLYSNNDLTLLEKQVDFDSLASSINQSKRWSAWLPNDKLQRMYAHALFNRGVLTGENSCMGGTLVAVFLD